MLSSSNSIAGGRPPAATDRRSEEDGGLHPRIVLFHNGSNNAAALHMVASQPTLMPCLELAALLRQLAPWRGYCVLPIRKRLLRRLRRTHRLCRCVTIPPESSSVVVRAWVPAPSTAWVSYAMTYRSAQLANAEQCRQYVIRCRMAYTMTMGGGWASVKNAREALRCSIELYHLAGQLHDAPTQRKCRVFVGWALVWHHDQLMTASRRQQRRQSGDDGGHVGSMWLAKAQHIFASQMDVNDKAQDEVNWNRCFAALNHWSHAAAQSPNLPPPDAVAKLSAAETLIGGAGCGGGGSVEMLDEESEDRWHDNNNQQGDVLNEWQHLFS